jgi:hypothetical protein
MIDGLRVFTKACNDSKLDEARTENTVSVLQNNRTAVQNSEKRKQAFIEWLETYPVGKSLSYNNRVITNDLVTEILDKAKEML